MKINRTREATPKEIERKFIVDSLPEDLDLSKYSFEKIDQGYLVNTPKGSVRIRHKGDKYYWTVKKPLNKHAAERSELETEITKQQFNTMWPGTEGKRLEKLRYKIPFGKYMIELDIFAGRNSGHVLAEVEFISTTAADQFMPPNWFGVEVTSDKNYDNSTIAEMGFPNTD